MIRHPARAPQAIVAAYPSHVHRNLLPRLQGRGVGTGLLAMWIGCAHEHGSRAFVLAPMPAITQRCVSGPGAVFAACRCQPRAPSGSCAPPDALSTTRVNLNKGFPLHTFR